MTAQQDFLPYAVGSSANVLSQNDYAALTSLLLNGLQSGIVPSNELNKILRQPSIMASVLGQFIVQTTGQPAIDDGTTATLLANFTTGVRSLFSGIVGQARNLAMNVSVASATATLTADEVIVESALGGLRYCIPNVNLSINLATTGIGGMDTGSAPTSGYVGIYLGYNPTTGVAGLFAQNATSARVGDVYGGANRPAGYTATTLVSVWPTDSTGKLKVGTQFDRKVSFPTIVILSSSAIVTNSVLALSLAAPINARRVSGNLSASAASSSTQSVNLRIAADTNNTGGKEILYAVTSSSGFEQGSPFEDLPVITTQTAYYTSLSNAGSSLFSVSINSYVF